MTDTTGRSPEWRETASNIPPEPRMVLHPPPPHPDEVTLLDYFAAAVLIAGLGISSQDIFEKAAALVAESHRRRRITP